jgi:hypothetical protein
MTEAKISDFIFSKDYTSALFIRKGNIVLPAVTVDNKASLLLVNEVKRRDYWISMTVSEIYENYRTSIRTVDTEYKFICAALPEVDTRDEYTKEVVDALLERAKLTRSYYDKALKLSICHDTREQSMYLFIVSHFNYAAKILDFSFDKDRIKYLDFMLLPTCNIEEVSDLGDSLL